MKRLLALLLFLPFSLFSSPEGNRISVITIADQIINPVAAEYIGEAIDRAVAAGDQALVIELDTPGGLLSSTRVIVKKILNAEVPVVVYVAPSGSRAGSAGVFITLASHVAVMAPSTNIGAAHPVEFGESPKKKEGESFREILKSLKKEKEGEGQKEGSKGKKTEKKSHDARRMTHDENPMVDKILNDTVAWVSTIAKARGRNVNWAVRAVKESISDGETAAVKMGVVDLVAKDLSELLVKIDGREVTLASGKKVRFQTKGAVIEVIKPNLRQRVLDVLINPNIAYLLMMLGFYGLLFEITHPGVWFPGVAGLICIILAFYAFHTLPTNYAGLALILLAMALFIAEVFVTSYGLLSIVGGVSLLLGSLFLVDSTAEFMQISLKLIIPVVLGTGLLFVFLVGLAVRVQRQKSSLGVQALVSQTAVVTEGGKAAIGNEIWDIVADEPLVPGDRIRVTDVQGMKLRVKKI